MCLDVSALVSKGWLAPGYPMSRLASGVYHLVPLFSCTTTAETARGEGAKVQCRNGWRAQVGRRSPRFLRAPSSQPRQPKRGGPGGGGGEGQESRGQIRESWKRNQVNPAMSLLFFASHKMGWHRSTRGGGGSVQATAWELLSFYTPLFHVGFSRQASSFL